MVGHWGARHAWLSLALLPLPLLGLMGVSAARANENYALIISASDYPNLPQRYWLKGPKNDATLVRDYLLHNAPVPFQPQNVTTLGSGDGMELATHQRILDGLAKLAKEAKKGDFVFIQFSGHGSQQPALNDPTEQDGKDEIFLSADAEMAPPSNPEFVPNVLTDDEMAAALKAIRKTGASVWVIFDSCHSGTMTRGAPDTSGVVMREIKPEDLGVPDSAFKLPAKAEGQAGKEAERSAPLSPDVYGDDAADASQGPLVAFFAAQTNEQAPENPYDVPGPDGTTTQENFGVFTHAIFTALARNPNLTYRQLAQSVLASYVADNWLRVTPLFEGKLDAQVFGNTDIVPTEQWPMIVDSKGGLGISAGQLQGLSAGSKLLIVPDPAAPNDKAVGIVQVSQTTELRSIVVPDADAAHPKIEASAVPAGAYARLEAVSYPFELKVARPDASGGDPDQVAAVNAALDAIVAQDSKPLRLSVVAPGDAADLKLAVMSDQTVAHLAGATADGNAGTLDDSAKLWLLPATGEISLDPGRRPPAMALAGATANGGKDFTKKLEETLTTIFRATGLSRLTTANTFAPNDFTLTFSRQDAGSDTLTPMAIEQTPMIRPNDRLYVDFANNSGNAVDLNLLYIDHDYGITPLCAAHLAAGDHLFQPFADIQDSDQGSERLIAVINESAKELTDLSFLAQPGLGGLREVGQQGLLGMIADLGAGQATRAVPVYSRDYNVPRGAVVMMPLEALPGTGAVPAAGIPPKDAPQVEGQCKV